MKKRRFATARVFGVLLVLSAACAPFVVEDPVPAQTDTSEPEGDFTLALAPYLPGPAADLMEQAASIEIVPSSADPDLFFDVSSQDPLFTWVYVLAAPFATIEEGISFSALTDLWAGTAAENSPCQTLIMDGSARAVFEKIWGAASLASVSTVSAAKLPMAVWEEEDACALLPFEDLNPAFRVFSVDGRSPLNRDFDPAAYPLTVPFSVMGEPAAVADFRAGYAQSFPSVGTAANWQGDLLTRVVMTGVTALTRATAYLMETNGYTYPAIDVGDLLRDADILHISNEIPFTETCPDPFARKDNDANLVFCSKPEYIQLLEAVGTDVVELTGDHFRDWGPNAMTGTLAMYEERGWQYYGGGYNFEDAVNPALFEHNGNKIAFLGCNAKPPGYATAASDYPGAVHCDMARMGAEVQSAVKEGYLPIFTFQHIEYYTYDANPALQRDFRLAADAGAVIVSGSQAHQPHAFEFYKNSFLHYGLGNLFFDQYDESFSQRRAFIDRHIFYDGRHISTELFPVMFIDMARPRMMTKEERVDLLTRVFTASGW